MYEFKNTTLPPRRQGAGANGRMTPDCDTRLFLLNDDQLDAWQERVALCTVDGGLPDKEAEAIAWRQIDAAQDAHAGTQAASMAWDGEAGKG